MKRIFFTVTNDLTYDQRMIRICSSLAGNGYQVTLVGRQLKSSVPLIRQPFTQKRLPCFFTTGKAFYVEFNLRLFFFLVFQRMNCICAIDLDTIVPCYCVSVLKKIPRVYDAHELFCEMKEVVTRPRIYSIWKKVERFTIPKFRFGYTVNRQIAEEFRKMYAVDYVVIRNFPTLKSAPLPDKTDRYILYQGAVNEGRSFETLIPAMKKVNFNLLICGDGNFMEQTRELVRQYGVGDKVIFSGKLRPEELEKITVNAWLGLTFFENKGLSNYYSLANRFSDYIHAGVPQLCVNYPAYREINDIFNVAILLDDLEPETIAGQISRLSSDQQLYETLRRNCSIARETLNWNNEEKTLIHFYRQISM